MKDYSSILKPMETAPTDGEVLMFGTSLKRPGEPLSAPDDVGVWAFCHRGAHTWRDGMCEFVPEGWVDLAELAMEKQESAVVEASLQATTSHLSVLVDQATDLLRQLRGHVGDLYKHWSIGGDYVRGTHALVDDVDDWLAARPDQVFDSAISRSPALGSGKVDSKECEPIGFVSPEQAAVRISDPEDASGVYLPIRKTAKGLFTMALYAHPHSAPPAAKTGAETLRALLENQPPGAVQAMGVDLAAKPDGTYLTCFPDFFISQIACNTIKATCLVHGLYEFSKVKQGDCVVPVFFCPPRPKPLTQEQREAIIQSAPSYTEAVMMVETMLGIRP